MNKIIFALGILLAAGFLLWDRTSSTAPAHASKQPEAIPTFYDLPLVDANGAPTDLRKHAGNWVLLYFGFLSCPDVCPTSLGFMAREYEHLGDLRDHVRVVFVSVDPERDSPKQVGEFAQHFNKNFVGVTGSKETLQQLSKAVGAFYRFVDTPESKMRYTVQHSAAFFVLSPNGQLVGTITEPAEAGSVSQMLRKNARI